MLATACQQGHLEVVKLLVHTYNADAEDCAVHSGEFAIITGLPLYAAAQAGTHHSLLTITAKNICWTRRQYCMTFEKDYIWIHTRSKYCSESIPSGSFTPVWWYSYAFFMSLLVWTTKGMFYCKVLFVDNSYPCRALWFLQWGKCDRHCLV